MGKLCDLEKARDLWEIEKFKTTREASFKIIVRSISLRFWIIFSNLMQWNLNFMKKLLLKMKNLLVQIYTEIF